MPSFQGSQIFSALGAIAPGEPLPGQGQEVAGLMAAMERYDSVIDMSETARTFGVELTPLEVAVGRMLGSASSQYEHRHSPY